ncbi:hypothetical protein [Actinoallomurus rhizosphaericola]|uniref:hypothetical protein n=1 Tax=Actinoallomurus rhizosphaericola TaxID=2952536 RepID=UPI002091E3CE|nr:hypothetical protein [Actinoallomurus rhizosphaericola]MCO5992849.1 hypothetical protein [Actinoallomurus rhizosphaericola]
MSSAGVETDPPSRSSVEFGEPVPADVVASGRPIPRLSRAGPKKGVARRRVRAVR